jgi:hypothetical protein
MYHEVLSRGEIMKAIAKGAIRNEKGQALILALILLAVGGLILAPLLAYMRTGLTAGEVCEVKTNELYAADAGVEDAVWKIQHQTEDVYYLYCGQGNHTLSYNITDVNGKSVAVTITYVDSLTYLVESIATGDGSGTKIDAYITGAAVYDDYSSIMNQILTSQGELDWKNKVTLNYTEGHAPAANYTDPWPPAWLLENFYGENVTGAPHYGDTEIDLEGQGLSLGPLYVGGKLTIMNSSNTPPTLTLTGTLYITGDTQIYGPTGNDPLKLTLDLNGQTIFVASNSSDPKKALDIEKCNIIGPGVIIAVGDIYFAPKADVGMTAPIFVLSVSGTTLLQPSGNFYGAIAGSMEVQIQPGHEPTITYPPEGFGGYNLNFPSLVEIGLVYSIASWEVSPL